MAAPRKYSEELKVLHRLVEPGQYRAIRYTERLAAADAVASVGSKGPEASAVVGCVFSFVEGLTYVMFAPIMIYQ
ncbi:MAG: hypothetical protein ACTH31_07335 [Pseudoclavibacter sp.]